MTLTFQLLITILIGCMPNSRYTFIAWIIFRSSFLAVIHRLELTTIMSHHHSHSVRIAEILLWKSNKISKIFFSEGEIPPSWLYSSLAKYFSPWLPTGQRASLAATGYYAIQVFKRKLGDPGPSAPSPFHKNIDIQIYEYTYHM